MQPLQLGVAVKAEPHRSAVGAHVTISTTKRDLTSSSGSSSAAPRPTSAGLVHIQRLSTLTRPGRQLCLTAKRLPGPLGNNRIPWSSLSSRKWIHLGEEDSVALGPRPKSKNQTLFRSVEWERQMRQQAALVLHKERRHAAVVLGKRPRLLLNPHPKCVRPSRH